MNANNRALKIATLRGAMDMLPLSLAVLPWGILFGSLAVQRGFSWLEAQLFSGVIFGGAVQIVTVELIADNSSLLTVMFTAFVISSRHLLYGLSLRERLSPKPLRWRLGLGFLLTDELQNFSFFQELDREQIKIAVDIYVHNKESEEFTHVINKPKSYMCLSLNQYDTVTLRIRVYSELLFFGEMAFSNRLFFEYTSANSGSNYFKIRLPKIDTDLLKYIYFNEEFVKYDGEVIYWNGREYRKRRLN